MYFSLYISIFSFALSNNCDSVASEGGKELEGSMAEHILFATEVELALPDSLDCFVQGWVNFCLRCRSTEVVGKLTDEMGVP